ncbi:hypothetical protein NQZ68_002309 [Dissostichus eleginoides]|nr:hypothetical protein NQZ68_002309 [Dissostichus eleginoides]
MEDIGHPPQRLSPCTQGSGNQSKVSLSHRSLISGRFVSNHSLMFDSSRRAQRDSFSTSPKTNSLDSQGANGVKYEYY